MMSRHFENVTYYSPNKIAKIVQIQLASVFFFIVKATTLNSKYYNWIY